MITSTSSSGRLRKFIPQLDRYRERYGNFTLTARDLEILETVYRYRYLEAKHIRALVAGSDQQITRRLQGLFHNRYIVRFLPPQRMRLDLEQGSPLIAYGLDLAGARALESDRPHVTDHNGFERRAFVWNKAQTRRTEWFLRHSVMLSDFRCALELAIRAHSEVDLLTWEQGTSRKGAVRPAGGGRKTIRISPDAYFAIRRAGKTRHCFVEVDRSTEELDRVMRKYVNYWWYLQSSEFQLIADPDDALTVLFVTTGGERLANMADTLRKLEKPNRTHRGGKGVFWFCLAADYNLEDPTSILGPIWRVTNAGGGRRSLC